MTANKPHKPEVQWEQTAFEELKATWPQKRVDEDDKILKELFKLAEDSPLMTEALKWAEQHGLKFFIDRKAVNCGGYYAEGTGVLVIAKNAIRDPKSAVRVITHEIRHAWQDYHGLCAPDFPIIANNLEFNRHFIRYALAEADGKAIGDRAAAEYEIAQLARKQKLGQLEEIDKTTLEVSQIILKHEDDHLRARFLAWFSDSWTARYYGDFASKLYGQSYGFYKKDLPVGGLEFRSSVPPIGNGINIDNIQDVLRLGVSFSGTKNYLAKLGSDIIPKEIISPSLANSFYGAANNNQKKLTTELRKAYLRVKTDRKNLPKHHPWP